MKWEPPLTKAGKPCKNCKPHKNCRAHPQRGRRTVFTPESKGRFLQAKRLGASDRRACMAAGWSHDALLKWKREVENGQAPTELVHFIGQEVPEAEQVLYLKALNAVHDGLNPNQVKKADLRAAHGLKVLERLYGKDTDPAPQTLNHTGDLRALLEKHKRKRKDVEGKRATDAGR